jgi:hypothetical protein
MVWIGGTIVYEHISHLFNIKAMEIAHGPYIVMFRLINAKLVVEIMN